MNLRDVWNSLKNLIKGGKQKQIMNDLGNVPKAQVSFLGQTKNVKHLTPYGMWSSPPIGSDWIIFSERSNSDDLQGIANDYINRPKPLFEGEIIFQNLKTGAFIRFDLLGNILVFSPASVTVTAQVAINAIAPLITATATTSVAVTAPLVNVTAAVTNFIGDVNITGTLTVDGINHNDHLHDENDAGGPTDGPRNP